MSGLQRMRGQCWSIAAAAALSLLLSGCISVGIGSDAGVQPMYELHDSGALPAAGAAPAPEGARPAPLVQTLQIQMLPGSAVAETTSIAYSRQPHEVAYYRLASWTERPVRSIPRLLQQRLEAGSVSAAVGLLGDPLNSDWLLTVTVEQLVHDVAATPGSAQVRLGVALYDRRSGLRIGSRSFDATAPVARADSATAVAAMSDAIGRSFDALVPWVGSSLQDGLARRARLSGSAERRLSAPIMPPIVTLK
ncbi:MAG: ABC-type transport auxiliary lipoprotein family protein [Rubrivivax sp.]